MQSPGGNPYAFPSLDSIELVLWPALAVAVFTLTAALVDIHIILAARWRLVDLPNQRSAHALPTVRGGGVAIVAMTLLATIPLSLRWPERAFDILVGICLPSLTIAIVGLIDDIRPMRAWLRLAIQCLVALMMIAILGPIDSIEWPGGGNVALGDWAWTLTTLWVVGMVNAFNFMDGSDGMAGLAAAVSGGCIAFLAWQVRAPVTLMLAAITAAGAAGFLVFNWEPARVFMGDIGSGFLGTMLASLPLMMPEPLEAKAVIPIAMCVWPFVFDPFVSVLRRIMNGKNPLEPHREFLFHRLIRTGYSHGRTAIFYGVLAFIGGIVAAFSFAGPMGSDSAYLPIIPLVLAAGLVAWIESRVRTVGLDGGTFSHR